MKIFSTLFKMTLTMCLMILISASVYGQSETQKREMLQLQEEIAKNQNNASYDMEAAQLELKQMAESYKESTKNVKTEVIVDNNEESDLIKHEKALQARLKYYTDFKKEIESARQKALSEGQDISKYDDYLKDINAKLELLK